MSYTFRTLLSPGRILATDPENLRLEADHVSRHIFIAGGSGSGKSKLIELICRQLIAHGCGFTFIDPHGDGTEAVLQYLAVRETDPARVHYWRPATDSCVSFDPFAEAPRGVSELEYVTWLETTVDRIIDAFLRNVPVADQEVMKRLRNWLATIFFACGLDVDGKHLGLADALVFTEPNRPEFAQVFDRIAPRLKALNPDAFYSLALLRDTSDYNRSKLIESSVNCLRDILRQMVCQIFGQYAPSISQREIILNKHIQLVNLRKSRALSRKQRNTIGGLIINFLMDAAENIGDERPYAKRVPHYLIIDEAENFIGEDLRMGFAELRKFRLSLCVAVQDLSCLRRGEMDLVNKVVSQCGLQMTFHQGEPEDIEYLGKSFGYGSLKFEPLMQNEVLPDGYDWVDTQSFSFGVGQSKSKSESTSEGQTESETRQRHSAHSYQVSVARALSESYSLNTSEAASWLNSESEARAVNWSDAIGASRQHSNSSSRANNWNESKGSGDTRTTNESESVRKSDLSRTEAEGTARAIQQSRNSGTGGSITDGITDSHGESMTHTEGSSLSETKGRSRGRSYSVGATLGGGETTTNGASAGVSEGESSGASRARSLSKTRGTSEAESVNAGVTFSKSPIARHKITEKDSGQLQESVNDQLAWVMNELAKLPDRTVLVKCKGMGDPFFMRIHDVLDPYVEQKILNGKPRNRAHAHVPEWQESDFTRYLALVRAAHPYHFAPTNARVEERVARLNPEPPPAQDAAQPEEEKNPYD